MIGYVTLGTNDVARAATFFDGIAQILGHQRLMEAERSVMWGTPGEAAIFCACKPFDGQDASVGNGTMFSFTVSSKDQVDRIHAYALANGGSDEGAPGPRGENIYGAYFRDPDGNKLSAILIGQP